MTTGEDRWTRPSAWQPNPGWWHAPDPDSAEDEVADLLWGLVRALQPELVVETGTAHGRTAARLCDALEANGHGRLVTFEADPDRARACAGVLAGRPATVIAARSLTQHGLPGDVTTHAPRFDQPVGLLFSDSDPGCRVAEVLQFEPEWFVLHDTAPHHPWADRLRRDLEELYAESYRWVHLPTPRGVIVGQRPREL